MNSQKMFKLPRLMPEKKDTPAEKAEEKQSFQAFCKNILGVEWGLPSEDAPPIEYSACREASLAEAGEMEKINRVKKRNTKKLFAIFLKNT